METRAGTDPPAWELDRVQYAVGEGPCVETLRDARAMFADHMRHRQEWPRYVPRAVEAGVRSQLALQLYTEAETSGV